MRKAKATRGSPPHSAFDAYGVRWQSKAATPLWLRAERAVALILHRVGSASKKSAVDASLCRRTPKLSTPDLLRTASRPRRIFATLGICAACTGTPAEEQALPHLPTERPQRGYVGGPYKVIAADFTNDGITDLALAYHPIDVVTLDEGDGQGQFSRLGIFQVPYDDWTRIEPVINIAAGDVDEDGLLDLAIAVGGIGPPPEAMQGDVPVEHLRKFWKGRAVVAKNLGEGRFQRVVQFPVESMAQGIDLADLDRDGRLDLLYTGRGSGRPGDTAIGKVYARQGLGGGRFGPALEWPAGPGSAYNVGTGDLNNDGFLDIMVANERGPTVTSFLNPGKELFAGERAPPPHVLTATPIPEKRTHAVNHVRPADFNGDGNLDLATANLGTGTISIFLGNGDGTFQKDILLDGGKYNAWLAIDDLDKDGDQDIVVTHWYTNSLAVLLNKGAGRFHARTDYQAATRPYGLAIVDADGDETLDVLTANYMDGSTSLLKGVGDGTFEAAVTVPRKLRLQDGEWVPHE